MIGPFEAHLPQLLDQQAGGLRRVPVELERIDILREDAGEKRHEVDALALGEFLRHQLCARSFIRLVDHGRDLLTRLVVAEQRRRRA